MGSKWQMEKHNDPYYKRAKQEDYRSRASYKLKQLDKKYKLIKEGNTVVDLGAAPGGWSQVALEKVGEEGIVVGVDLNRFKKFHEENYYGIRGDFTTPEVQQKIMDIIGGKAKVVMSDASPSLCGIKNIDQLRSIDLVNVVIEIAENILEEKGNLVMKICWIHLKENSDMCEQPNLHLHVKKALKCMWWVWNICQKREKKEIKDYYKHH